MSDKLLLTIDEAATLIFGDASPKMRKRMYRLIELEAIESIRDGKMHYIPRKELAKLGGLA